MTDTIKVPNEVAREAAGIDAPWVILTDPEFFAPITEIVENRSTGQRTRWDEIWELVVKMLGHGDRLWRTTYRVGLTENQDYPPFDYGGDVEFKSVERKTRMVEEVYYEWTPGF